MAKAVNQNDLIHIVNSHVGAVTDIMGVILGAMENNDFTLDTSVKDKTEKFKDNINAVLGENGVFTVVSDAIERANNLPSKDASAKAAENFVGGVDAINQSIKALSDVRGLSQKKAQKIMQSLKYISIVLDVYYQTMSDFDADKLNKIPVEAITKVVDALKSILLIFKDISMGYLLSIPIKIWLLKRATKKILKYFLWLSGVEIKKGFGKGRMVFTPYQIVARLIPMLPAFAFMQIALMCLLKVVKQIHETKIGWFLFGIIKLWFLKKFTKRLFKFFNTVTTYYYMNGIGQGVDQQSLMKMFLKIYVCVWFMKAIVANVAKMSWAKLIGAWLKIGFYRNVFKNISITMNHLKKTSEDAVKAAGPRYMRLIKLYIVFIMLKRIVKKISKMGFFRMIIATKNIKRIKSVFIGLKEVIKIIKKLNINKIIPKLRELKTITKLIKKIIKQITKTRRTKSALKKLGRIADIFGHSKEKPLPGHGSIYQIMNRVRRWTIAPAIKKMAELLTFVTLVKLVVKTINSIRASKKLIKKLGKIQDIFGDKKFGGKKGGKKSITGGSITDLIKGARNLPSTKRAVKKLLKVTAFALALGQMILALLLLVPLLVLFTLGAPILIMGVWILGKVLKILVKVVKHIKPTVFRAVYKLTILIGALCLLGLGLLMLGMLGSFIIDSIGGILLFFVVIGVLAMACWGLSYLAPIIMGALMPILGVIGAMALIVFLMLAVAAMLWLLAKIELDQELIITNVKIVLKTAWCIIENVFAGDDADSEENDKGFAESLLTWVFNGIGAILIAILAVAYIALIFIAVAFILLIASMLRVLQILDLDPDKIGENVGIVLATAQMVIDSIFDKGDEDGEKSDRSYLEIVLERIGNGFVMIIQALLAVVYLALIAFSIGMILLIAGMLRLLQMLDLDPDKIAENVGIVISTAQMIINSIFDKDDDKDKPSKKGFIRSIIETFLGGFIMILEAIMAVAYLALISLCVGIIWGIAGMLRGLQEIELDAEKIENNVDIVISTAQQIIDSIMDRDGDDENPSNSSWIKDILGFFGLDGILKIIDAIMAVGFLALTAASVSIIKGIAEDLMTILSIDFNGANIEEKVTNIIKTAQKCTKTVMEREQANVKPIPKKDLTFWERLAVACGAKQEDIQAMRAIGWLEQVYSIVEALSDTSEKVSTIMNFKPLLVTDIEQKVDDIVSVATTIMKKVMVSSLAQDKVKIGNDDYDWTDCGEQLVKNFTEINKTLDQLKTFALHCKALGEYQYDLVGDGKTLPPYRQVIKTIMGLPRWIMNETIKSAAEIISDRMTFMSNAEMLQSVVDRVWGLLGGDPAEIAKNNNSIQARVNMVKAHTDNLIRFMDKVNSMDLTKMQTAENLFKHMAEFSNSINGNFDKLAEALNDKIAPLLEEFNSLLKETPAKIDANVKDLLGLEGDSTNSSDNTTTTSANSTADKVQSGFKRGMQAIQNASKGAQQGKGKDTTQQATNKAKKRDATIQDIYDVLVGQGQFTKGVKVHN